MIVNLQRKIRLDTAPIKKFLDVVVTSVAETEGRECSVAFVSDRRMKELNGFFRGKDSTTDVLSFPHEADEFVRSASFTPSGTDEERTEAGTLNENYLGDIVISVEQAAKQATENKLTLEREIKQLILHGLLHLCGYDHETDDGEMNKRELELRKLLRI